MSGGAEEMQADWFVREVKRCAAIGMPLGCCEEWPECSHVLAWTEGRARAPLPADESPVAVEMRVAYLALRAAEDRWRAAVEAIRKAGWRHVGVNRWEPPATLTGDGQVDELDASHRESR